MKLERIKHLKIALRPGHQVLAGRFRKASQPVASGLVNHVTLPGLPSEALAQEGDLDHPRLAERTTKEILDEFPKPVGVSGSDPHDLIDTKARVPPTANVDHDLPGDIAFAQEQIEHRLLRFMVLLLRGRSMRFYSAFVVLLSTRYDGVCSAMAGRVNRNSISFTKQ
jgi:hypothetical protein